MINIEQKIKAYLDNGINCIAIDEHKRPFTSWKQYQDKHITPEVLIAQIADLRAAGIAIICGKISGNLEVIDVDCKYDLTGTLYHDLIDTIPHSIFKKLLIIKTKNNGYHLYYRCKTISGNKKLAQRKATPEEELNGDKVLVLIETRGEGGYVVAPPSEGYSVVQNNTIEYLTESEREVILHIAESFNQLKDEVKDFKHMHQQHHSGVSSDLAPWTDYNKRGIDDMLSRLVAAGWKEVRRTNEKVIFLRPGKTDSRSSGDFNFKLGWFSVFTTSSEFHPNKAYRPSDVFCVLEKIKDGKELYHRLNELGYGVKEPLRQLRRVTGKKNVNEILSNEEEIIFFEETKNNIKILSYPFLSLLNKKGGFGLYTHDKSKDYIFVRVVSGIVEVATVVDMKKFTEQYIDTIYESPLSESLKQAIQAQADKLFSKNMLEFLPFTNLNLLQHTADSAFYPFKNGVLKITADTKTMTPYDQLKMHVWRSHIIDFNFNIGTEVFNDSDFFSFISKICGDDPERIKFTSSVVGYLLHTYKDKARPYSVILAEETENEEKGGGTGKGIFFRAISKIINTIVVDGKSFKHDKPFLFQRANLDTQLIVIDDCRKNIDFQGFYSHISEGLTIEKKNRDEIHIPYETAPKFLFSTNYTINIDGTHGRRRALTIEFSNFFNEENTPLKYFGHMLFDGWDESQWNEFYAAIAIFVQKYLIDGVQQNTSSPTIIRKEIINRYGKDFLEFWDDVDKAGNWQVLNDLYANFLTSTDTDKKDYSARKFSTALSLACERLGYTFEVKKNRQNGGKRDVKICGAS